MKVKVEKLELQWNDAKLIVWQLTTSMASTTTTFCFNPYLEIVDKKSTNWDLSQRHLWTKNPQKFFLGIQ